MCFLCNILVLGLMLFSVYKIGLGTPFPTLYDWDLYNIQIVFWVKKFLNFVIFISYIDISTMYFSRYTSLLFVGVVADRILWRISFIITPYKGLEVVCGLCICLQTDICAVPFMKQWQTVNHRQPSKFCILLQSYLCIRIWNNSITQLPH